ncbi:hypothetical protein BO94DRAFT_589043 [Aspergillus sclerotioniger CBS 115572]|uniref:Uncharacterized protein n=1 Tax=Aspergillus sclerotioniger CBS 115572 TaxID=1450535 RepID=A0A317VQP0_9EURO|nr:hypothetical protein BO94DRAFT_589043 [Aspergillus sclerotioniger CBS 115572]PWY75228.1 hypothetical protein BO94DRAFT_589043 [Aspergillus sclerotioniger CBS 115572]
MSMDDEGGAFREGEVVEGFLYPSIGVNWRCPEWPHARREGLGRPRKKARRVSSSDGSLREPTCPASKSNRAEAKSWWTPRIRITHRDKRRGAGQLPHWTDLTVERPQAQPRVGQWQQLNPLAYVGGRDEGKLNRAYLRGCCSYLPTSLPIVSHSCLTMVTESGTRGADVVIHASQRWNCNRSDLNAGDSSVAAAARPAMAVLKLPWPKLGREPRRQSFRHAAMPLAHSSSHGSLACKEQKPGQV